MVSVSELSVSPSYRYLRVIGAFAQKMVCTGGDLSLLPTCCLPLLFALSVIRSRILPALFRRLISLAVTIWLKCNNSLFDYCVSKAYGCLPPVPVTSRCAWRGEANRQTYRSY
eukprot:jgi/Chrzof1/9320/UNPLg00289.t1